MDLDTEIVFLVLFIVATAVAILARRLRIPYTVALVLAGLLLGMAHAFEPPHLTKGLLYSLFLPGLLFEAAFHLDARHLFQNKLTILGLAVPGVIGAMAITALLLVPSIGVLTGGRISATPTRSCSPRQSRRPTRSRSSPCFATSAVPRGSRC